MVISLKYIEKEEDLAKRGEKSRIIFIINTQTGKLSYALIKIIETVIICAILRQLKCKYIIVLYLGNPNININIIE